MLSKHFNEFCNPIVIAVGAYERMQINLALYLRDPISYILNIRYEK